MTKRAASFSDAHEREHLRALGNAVRARALSKLPDLLEQLEQNLTRNGVTVHWAETVDEANGIVLSIIRAHEGRQVIKGKSMVSEEMEMNHFLADRGIECLESDMGEYIVQLDHEKPSHIIMPAIHKNAGQVASLFHDKLGVEYTKDVDQLIQIGRKVLRQKFFEADIGVSGVNFAVAETGTLLLVENEGNGRMTTTVPPVHIAVTGIEKVVENLRDVVPLLSLLTRSALGQPITTYVNMISGPRQEHELDGPQEVHLVLLDNGRSQAFADSELRQTLNCIRCGACMNHCPVYTRVGGHAYGEVYPGPIGKIITPHMVGLAKVPDHPSASSLCGACGEVCPVKIPIPALLRRLRKRTSRPPTARTRSCAARAASIRARNASSGMPGPGSTVHRRSIACSASSPPACAPSHRPAWARGHKTTARQSRQPVHCTTWPANIWPDREIVDECQAEHPRQVTQQSDGNHAGA